MRNTLTSREEGDVAVMDVHEKLIGTDSIALRAILQELAESSFKKVLLDLAGVTHIGTVGIDELIADCTNLAHLNGALRLLNPQKREQPPGGSQPAGWCLSGVRTIPVPLLWVGRIPKVRQLQFEKRLRPD